eukprot:TRINITY_DN4202_c0_g1_i1.p1 TRINITY_DN4202_c0_g1~~TRINITY_DN4202_c0_g1_i1.p1  ORF type:complete len:4234 (+),score=1265.77 TRINITY_DN4202_c0_g1_i1:585-12704(+)
MAFGSPSPKTPFFFNVTFKTMRGKHKLDEQLCCRDDLYRLVFDSDFTDVCIKLLKYKTGDPINTSPSSQAHPVALSDDQTKETNDVTDAGASDANTEATGDKGVVKRIAKATKSLAAGMKFAFYGDSPGLRAEVADMAHPKPEQLTQVFGTIIHPSQAAAIRLFIYYDVPSVEENAREKLSHKVDELPKLGMHVDILSGEVNYGPFINFMRAKVQSLFLPWDFRTWGLYRPRDGDWREHAAYEQVVTFACDCNIVVPWRQKKEGLDPPRGMEYSGRNQSLVIKVGKGSRYVYKYPYLQISKGEGVLTETYFEMKNCVMTTSLTGQELLRAKQLSLHMDYLYAANFVFNELHHVDYILNVTQGEMWYLTDIGTYFSDLIADWGYPWVMYLSENFKEEWSGNREFMVKEYMPYTQRIELFFDGFDLHLNANEGNVIERHATKKDNAIVTCRIGEATAVYCTPNDVFTVAQENEFDNTFEVKVSPMEFLLTLPEKHECFNPKHAMKYLPECFATIESLHLNGVSRAMWPDTNEAQGRPTWVPKRDVPASWSSAFPRKPRTDTSHDIVDLVTITLKVDRVTSVLRGWHLKHLGHLASNYGGSDASFVSAKDFARFSSAAHPRGRNVKSAFSTYLSAPPWKTAEVSVSVTVSSAHLYFPLSQNSVTVFQALARQSSDTNVAIYADLSAPAIGSIPRDAQVTVLGTCGDWAQIAYNGQSGWANANKLLPVKSTGRRYNNGYVYRAKNPSFWQDEGAGDFIVVAFHDTDVGVYTTPTCSDMSVTLSPITIQCPVAGLADKRSQDPEYFVGIDSVVYNACSLYGPAPLSQCFSTRKKLHVGAVTGHLLISQLALIEEIAETLSTHMTYKDLGLEQLIEDVRMPLEHSAWGRSVDTSDYHDRRKLSREELRKIERRYEGLEHEVDVLINPWYCENTMAEFKMWLDNKETIERDASEKAYVTHQVSLVSLAMNLKLETGYCTASFSRGVTLGGSTLHDGNSNMRGTLMVPSFNIRLLNCKAGGLLREMEGDHLEVGQVSGALSVRYTETKNLGTGVSDFQEAQRMFFQKFDLSNYGLKGIIDIESHQWQPASPRNSPRSRYAAAPHLGVPKRTRKLSNALPPPRMSNPLISLNLNVNDEERVPHSLEVSPSTQGRRVSNVERPKEGTPECETLCLPDEELIDLQTAAMSVPLSVATPVSNASTLSELGTPPSNHLYSPMLATSASNIPMQTCMSEISDNSTCTPDSPTNFLNHSFGRRSSGGSYWSGSLPSLRSGLGPKNLTRRMSLPASPGISRRRSLEIHRPPRLSDTTKYGALPWEDPGPSLEGGAEEPNYQNAGHDAELGADMNEYASCLQSAKLHVFRVVPKDSALLYGKGHLYRNPMYAYAPHPKVSFEDRGKKTADNTLFRQREQADNEAFRKRLLTPSQVVDTTENLRENTSTYHTHVSFLQPMNVLVTRQAACLVMQGAALHSLWKQDIKNRNTSKRHGKKKPSMSFSSPKKEGRRVVFKTETIVSVQLSELVAVCVLGISGSPHTLRCVVQNTNLTRSVRSSGMCPITSGKNPSHTISLRVGAIGCAFQAVTSKVRSIDAPEMPDEMRDALIIPEHRLLSVVCILPTAINRSCLLVRGKSEQQPSSLDFLRKYTVNITNISVNLTKDALALRNVSSQLTFLNVAWNEMQNEDNDTTYDPLSPSAEDIPLQLDASTSCMSYVMVENDGSGKDTNRPPTLQRLRIAARKMLFGATEAVIDALNRRSRKENQFTDGTFSTNVGPVPPPDDDMMSGSGVLVERPSEEMDIVVVDDQCVLPDVELVPPLPLPVRELEREASRERAKEKEAEKEKGFASWLNSCLAFHLTVHVDQISGSLAAHTVLALKQDPEAQSPSWFRIKDFDVKLLGNEKGARKDALARAVLPVVPVPVTMLTQVGSLTVEVNASITNLLQPQEPQEVSSPLDQLQDSEAEAGVTYYPWIYASLVVNNTEFKVLHTAHNFMVLGLKKVTALATNRPRLTNAGGGVRQPNMSASPDFQKHRKTFNDLAEAVNFGTNPCKPPGHRSRPSDEQLSATPAHAHSEPLVSPRSRAGSVTQRKKSLLHEPPKWTISISLSKKIPAMREALLRDGATLAYYCRPIKSNGELHDDVCQVFCISLKTLQMSAILPKWDTTASLVAHLALEGIRASITSREWMHTDHYLKEWQKLALRLKMSSSTPVEVMSPMQAMSPSPSDPAEQQSAFVRPMLSVTIDVSRVEIDVPMPSDMRFSYHLKRIVLSSVEIDDYQIVKVHIYPSCMKAADDKEALFPGARMTYCTGEKPTLECHIDRVEVIITNEILNAWLHMYTVIAPEVMRWIESKVHDDVQPRVDVSTPNLRPSNATIMWAGIRITFIADTTELTASSGMGIARYKEEERSFDDSFLPRYTTFPYDEAEDLANIGLEHASTAPTPCGAPLAHLHTMWYLRLPKFNIGLHDLDKSPVVMQGVRTLQTKGELLFDNRLVDKRRVSVKTPKLEQDDQGEQGVPDRPHFGYRWASGQFSFYAGNCDVESLAQQDIKKARAAHMHKKSHSGGLERNDAHRSSLASLPAVVIEPPQPSTPVKEKKAADKVDVLVANTMLMFRAGAPEQMKDLFETYTKSMANFQDTIEKDKKRFMEGEALRKLKKEGRKWIKKTTETMEKARDPATYISSTIGSVSIKSTSLTIPFGDKTYWSCRSIAVNGPEALLDSIYEDTFTRTLDEPITIDKIWKTAATRPLPSQALQIHIGEASVATLMEQDDAPEDAAEQPKKVVVLCKARDVSAYFSDGHPLPPLWARERGGRIDPKAGWHRQFGPNFSYIVGGKGVFLPASRELAAKDLRSRCAIKEITVRARAKMWSDSISPLMVSYDVSGPELRIAPNIVSCITDLADDFMAPPILGSVMKSSARESVSPPRGQPSLSASIVSEPPKQELSLDMDIVGRVESGTITVHSDEPLPAAFRQVAKDESKPLHDAPHTTIFKLPLPCIELRATVKIPTSIDETVNVTQIITASILASMPSAQDKITIHPTAVYFTNELVLWKRSWPGRKAHWRDTIESHMDGLHEMLKDGLVSAQVGSVKVTGTSYTVSATADSQDSELANVYLNNMRLLDVLVPVPMSLVDYSGCKEGCQTEHTGTCAKCGKPWIDHVEHQCQGGGRGVWRAAQTAEPPVARPSAPKVLKLRSDLVCQRGSLVYKQIVVKIMADPTKAVVLKVDALSSVEEMEAQCRQQLQISPCWKLDVRDADRGRVLLRYDDVIDGETYMVGLVGAQIFLSLRIKPITVVATTAPISECAAMLESGTMEVTVIKTPKGKGANVTFLLSMQPILTTGCALRVLIKDRHHECIAASVTGITALYSASFTKKLLLHVTKAPGSIGDAPALRFTTRVGHLKSFFIVYKLWKKKSDEAMAELVKHTATADKDGTLDYSMAKDDCLSQEAPSVMSTCVTSASSKSNQVFVMRLDTLVVDVDNFRLSHSDSSNDKFQLTVENTYLMASERYTKASKDGSCAGVTPKKSPLAYPSTPPSSELSIKTSSSLRPKMRQTRSGTKSIMDIRNIELGIGGLSFEAQGRIASQPTVTKTSDYLIVKSKQLLNAHKLPRTDEEHSSTPLQCIAVNVPPLEVELREMFKPLFKLKVHRKNTTKPACSIIIKDNYKPMCTPSSSNPLQGYQVDVSLVAENIDMDLRPLIFVKMEQVKAELLRTKVLQEAEADKALKGGREKKKALVLNRHLGTHGFVGRSEQATTIQTGGQTDSVQREACQMVPRGLVSISVGEFVVNLGYSGQQSSIMLRTQKFGCQMAQNLQRVDQKYLWDRLETGIEYSEFIKNDKLLVNGTIGRVDRIIKDLTITSWKVSRQVGETEAMLIKGDKDSFFSMHTNQYLGGRVVEYSFKSKFQQAWGVGKSQEFIMLREWLDGFLKEAGLSAQPGSTAAMPSSVSPPPQADQRQYIAVENGFAFSPTLQVVGESTLPISTILSPLGIEEGMIPAALHTYLGDTLEAALQTTYRTLAPLHVVKTNQSLVSDFVTTYEVVEAAAQEKIREARQAAPPQNGKQ